jgi:hypothetical protein
MSALLSEAPRAYEAGPGFFQKSAPTPSGAQLLHENAYRQGVLREVITTDDTGRRIRRFYGHPGACWSVFAPPIQRFVSGWNTKP